MNKQRPEVTEEIIEEAATEIVERIGDGDVDAIVDNYSYPMDGYDLALQLVKWSSWDVSRDEMETLDEMDSLVGEKLRNTEQQWFDENDIKPPFPVGAVIAIDGRFYDGVNQGEITGISEHRIACYEVKPIGQDDEKTGRCRSIIKFEDAVLAPVGIDSEGGAQE